MQVDRNRMYRAAWLKACAQAAPTPSAVWVPAVAVAR